MTPAEYQADLRRAYIGGGPGAFVSGIVWLVAAIIAEARGVGSGFVALFFGGILIFPLSSLLVRLFAKREGPVKGNPGGLLVTETLPGMFLGLLIAWVVIDSQPEWVFPIAAMAVGTHYFPFRTSYGDVLYWVLGGIMTSVGFVALMGTVALPFSVPFVIAGIEIVFGVILIVRNLGGRALA
ncbi:hypothetical protein HK107_07105 [Parvularcula sp. ZS-1/3]|uniref:DUF308 domain-containing protein n=1 Tax=Parvularcula mediterranea TaxID=2732508 RepID=A0A7Y3W599_9PROT|nr:hypothetical protein [Parvularcula mediterranea]NNU16087.1 hypothetical protein [Parvularcula mediterranea]